MAIEQDDGSTGTTGDRTVDFLPVDREVAEDRAGGVASRGVDANRLVGGR